jgi:hypothetical protein
MYTVSIGNTIQSLDINQCVNVLFQPSGGSETGKYWLGFASYTGAGGGAVGSLYMPSRSRGASPVSLTLDETDQAHNNCGAIQNDHLTANGFHAYSFGSGVFTSCNVGGNYTINF